MATKNRRPSPEAGPREGARWKGQPPWARLCDSDHCRRQRGLGATSPRPGSAGLGWGHPGAGTGWHQGGPGRWGRSAALGLPVLGGRWMPAGPQPQSHPGRAGQPAPRSPNPNLGPQHGRRRELDADPRAGLCGAAVYSAESGGPVVAQVPSAPEADGNFCGLNPGPRRAGLFGLAACSFPTPFLIRCSPP